MQSRTIAHYELREELGRGGLSVVHRAHDTLRQREVAIKLLEVEPESEQEFERWWDSFRKDAENAGKLSHPHIAEVLDAGHQDKLLYLVTQLIEGRPYNQAARGKGLRSKLALALQVSDALSYAHAQGVTHRGIKPSNLLVTPQDQVMITDFGLAQLGLPPTMATPTPFRLRPHYRSPEELLGKRYDLRSDIYAYGVTLFELLLEELPFQGEGYIEVTQRILNSELPRVAGSSHLPRELRKLLRRCLAKDPLDRHQHMREVHRALEAIWEQAPDTPVSQLAAESSTQPTARLTVEEDGRRRVAPITGESFSIGRRSENDLALSDEHVSRSHAKILRVDDRFYLEDCDSRHGTYLEGTRIQGRVPLSHGDRIRIGKTNRFLLSFAIDETLDLTTSWSSDALGQPDQQTVRNLQKLLELTLLVGATLEVEGILNLVMDSALDLTEAERGFLMLRSSAHSGFEVRSARRISDAALQDDHSISRSVVDHCLTRREPVVYDGLEGAPLDPEGSIANLQLNFIVCVPLKARGEVIGVLYLDSQRARSPLRSDVVDLLAAFANNAALSIERAQLYEQTTRDPLTQLRDRGYFKSRLEQEFHRSLRRGSELSLIFLDIDRFKQLNDTRGHVLGDRVLIEVAKRIDQEARISDVPARYGGEEFVILCPETSLEDSALVAERLRTRIRDLTIVDDDEPVSVTVSVGVASLAHTSMDHPMQLVGAADKAMYTAKKRGGDRVVQLAPSDFTPPLDSP